VSRLPQLFDDAMPNGCRSEDFCSSTCQTTSRKAIQPEPAITPNHSIDALPEPGKGADAGKRAAAPNSLLLASFPDNIWIKPGRYCATRELTRS
jgi:hypothetical protein